MKTLTPPEKEPVTLDEMKRHLRVEHAEDDALITVYIRAAREAVEKYTSCRLITQQVRVSFAYLSSCVLPVGPVQRVDSVASGGVGVLAYKLFNDDWVARLELAAPAVNAEVVFTAGFGAVPEDVPEPLRQAVRLLAAMYYENREGAGATEQKELPLGIKWLISPYRLYVR